MQKIPSTSQDPVFVEIDSKECLRTILNGKTVIEYPTIIIGECQNTSKLRTIITPVGAATHHPPENPVDSRDGMDYTVGIEDVDKIIETNKRGSLASTYSHLLTSSPSSLTYLRRLR